MKPQAPAELKQGTRVEFMNGDVDPEPGIVNGDPWVFFDGAHVKSRLPVAVDLAAHMERRAREREWKYQLDRMGAMFGGIGLPRKTTHETNVDDYVSGRIKHDEYERREGERLSA